MGYGACGPLLGSTCAPERWPWYLRRYFGENRWGAIHLWALTGLGITGGGAERCWVDTGPRLGPELFQDWFLQFLGLVVTCLPPTDQGIVCKMWWGGSPALGEGHRTLPDQQLKPWIYGSHQGRARRLLSRRRPTLAGEAAQFAHRRHRAVLDCHGADVGDLRVHQRRAGGGWALRKGPFKKAQKWRAEVNS